MTPEYHNQFQKSVFSYQLDSGFSAHPSHFSENSFAVGGHETWGAVGRLVTAIVSTRLSLMNLGVKLGRLLK